MLQIARMKNPSTRSNTEKITFSASTHATIEVSLTTAYRRKSVLLFYSELQSRAPSLFMQVFMGRGVLSVGHQFLCYTTSVVGRRPSLRIYYLWLSFEHQSPDLLKTKPFDLFETIELEFKRGPNLHILAPTACWVRNHVEADGTKIQKIVKIISYYFLSSKVCTWRHDNGNDQPGPWLKFLRMKSSSLNVAREGNIPQIFSR